MALEKCPECGGQLSTAARLCPHYGCVRAQKIALAIAVAERWRFWAQSWRS